MKVSDSEKIKILDFIACCDDFTRGKFLLVDSKVNNILKKIGECDALYGLFEDVLRNYNFEKEFSHAQIKFIGKPAKFEMPTEPFKILPLVFCILVKIQDKSLDFATFLKTYFSGAEEEFVLFGNQVITPFRNIIAAVFEMPVDMKGGEIENQGLYPDNSAQSKLNLPKKEVVAEHREDKMEEFEIKQQENYDEMDVEATSYFDEMKKLINDMMTEIDYLPRLKKEVREEAYIILDAMISACELQDLKILNGLIVGFEYIAPSIKNIKFLYKELKKVLLDLYEEM